MAEFLTDKALNKSLDNIIIEAKKELILVSPYIKLYERFYSLLSDKKNEKGLSIFLIFRDPSNLKPRSETIRKIDLDFFKQFPNIEIRMHANLHAKMYSNESDSLITSLNLLEYSHKKNIEFGIVNYGGVSQNKTKESIKINRVIRSRFEFLKERSTHVYTSKPGEKGTLYPELYPATTMDNIGEILNIDNVLDPTELPKTDHGYCIRTGRIIEFNINFPMSASAYNIWLAQRNPDYPELFCHFSGEETYGKTSFGKPILKKNWNKAMLKHLSHISNSYK